MPSRFLYLPDLFEPPSPTGSSKLCYTKPNHGKEIGQKVYQQPLATSERPSPMFTSHSQQIVQKLWNYCNILRDDDLSYGDYVEPLTYLLFLKNGTKSVGVQR